MGNYIAAVFNNWFGSNTTNVANARSSFVWACFHVTRLQPKDIKAATDASIEKGMPLEMTWECVTQNGLVKIPSMDFHRIRRITSEEYLTIIDHNREPLVINYLIAANRSFIITKDGALKGQKYGSNNFFEDERGVIYD